MKQYKILIFLLILLLPHPSMACIDDPDDWDDYEYYNDDDYDDCVDGGELNEVVCTPNHDDEEDGISLDEIEDDDEGYAWEKELEEHVVTSYSNHDDNNDNDDRDCDDDNLFDDDNNLIDDDNCFDYIETDHMRMIEAVLPESWKQSDYIFSCVVTAMEYIWNIITKNSPPNMLMRYTFEDLYLKINNKYDPYRDGVSANEVQILLSAIFKTNQVYDEKDIMNAIDQSHPVMAIISGSVNGEPCLHEIVIVGYDDYNDEYLYIDPASGHYGHISYYSITGYSFSIFGLKQ